MLLLLAVTLLHMVVGLMLILTITRFLRSRLILFLHLPTLRTLIPNLLIMAVSASNLFCLMPKYECLYDPKRDLMAVVPDLAVDLAMAIEHGVILDTGTVTEHNDIEDTTSIVGRVRDCFDAFEAQRAIKAAAKAASASAAVAKASEPAAPAASSASAEYQSTATQ